jgi:hypothetical protein
LTWAPGQGQALASVGIPEQNARGAENAAKFTGGNRRRNRRLTPLLLPFAVALPRMLERIETELATARPAEKWPLRQRAELVRELLAPASVSN